MILELLMVTDSLNDGTDISYFVFVSTFLVALLVPLSSIQN